MLDTENGHAKQFENGHRSSRAPAPRSEAFVESSGFAFQVLEHIPTNAMFADRDGIIRYANKATLETFRGLEAKSGIRAEALVGKSYDIFHKNPDRVRRLLADPRNLPHHATIDFHGEKLSLHVNAMYAADGSYCGALLMWELVTEHLRLQDEHRAQKAVVDAVSRSQALIEFNMDGIILGANENFVDAMGYSLNEIVGKHHRIFATPEYARSPEYSEFWAGLRRGEASVGEFQRVGRGGREIWLQASYNPVLDQQGKPFKVVKFAQDTTAQVRRRGQMQKILHGVASSAQELGSSSNDLTALSQQMSANAEETANQANTVSAAAEQVSQNIQTVAAGTEEMSVSIREIAKNAAEAARVASSAVKVAAATNSTVAKLGESSAEVGNVIKVITSIAQQTKLLALNATIEAARAGEAGKGFAVVANEVKELAKETAKATEDISQRIEAIQSDTRGAVAAIGQISSIIDQINDIQNTIASAVEEQTATTNEIGRNVAEGSKGASEIAANISGVATAARDTTEGTHRTLAAAKALGNLAASLTKLVADFEG